MIDADIVLEQVACQLEQPDLLDIMGIAAKRKRAREDADLRMRVRQEQRRELARWVRSFKSDKGNSQLRFLESVRDGTADQWAWGPEVAAALLGRLVTATIAIPLSTHMRNAECRYDFALTKDGQERLDSTAKSDTESAQQTEKSNAVN